MSTIGPRAVLIRIIPRFAVEKAAAPIRLRVSAVSGAWIARVHQETQKTPGHDLDLARRRMKEMRA